MKNFWSLNVDEVLVADALQAQLRTRGWEVFYPLNAQLKSIDLVLTHLAKRRVVTIQVKGSRTFEPRMIERQRYGAGASSWFQVRKQIIQDSRKIVDAFIFVVHGLADGRTRKEIRVDYLVIPTKDFEGICLKKVPRADGSRFDFFFWIDSKGHRAFDIESGQGKEILVTKYLNNWDLLTKW